MFKHCEETCWGFLLSQPQTLPYKKLKVCNDQEMAQSVRNSHTKTPRWENLPNISTCRYKLSNAEVGKHLPHISPDKLSNAEVGQNLPRILK